METIEIYRRRKRAVPAGVFCVVIGLLVVVGSIATGSVFSIIGLVMGLGIGFIGVMALYSYFKGARLTTLGPDGLVVHRGAETFRIPPSAMHAFSVQEEKKNLSSLRLHYDPARTAPAPRFLDGNRKHTGRDDVLMVAMISDTLQPPVLSPERVTEIQHFVLSNGLAQWTDRVAS